MLPLPNQNPRRAQAGLLLHLRSYAARRYVLTEPDIEACRAPPQSGADAETTAASSAVAQICLILQQIL
jgi:hypothetical protein